MSNKTQTRIRSFLSIFVPDQIVVKFLQSYLNSDISRELCEKQLRNVGPKHILLHRDGYYRYRQSTSDLVFCMPIAAVEQYAVPWGRYNSQGDCISMLVVVEIKWTCSIAKSYRKSSTMDVFGCFAIQFPMPVGGLVLLCTVFILFRPNAVTDSKFVRLGAITERIICMLPEHKIIRNLSI